MKRIRFITICLLAIAHQGQSQFRLPAFDLSIKGGISFIPSLMEEISSDIQIRYQYNAPVVSGELNFHLGQRVAIGGFWTRGNGEVNVELENPLTDLGNYTAGHQMYGASLRLSAPRTRRFRLYNQLSYFKSEMYFDYGSYRAANNTSGLGFTFGAMIKLSDKLSLNFPDVSLRKTFGDFYFMKDNGFMDGALLELRGGLTYNFSRRK